MEAFFRGSHTTNFVTWGFNKSYNQAAEVPSSNVTRKSPCSPSINCRIMLAFVSMTHSITTFPAPFLTAIETLSLCTSMPIYLVLVIKGCSFLKGLSQALKTYSKRGALYIASHNRTSAVLGLQMSGKCCQLNRSTQHFLEVYSQEFEILKFCLDADLTAAPPCPDPLAYNQTGRFPWGSIAVIAHLCFRLSRAAKDFADRRNKLSHPWPW